jgi:hypothetical protein
MRKRFGGLVAVAVTVATIGSAAPAAAAPGGLQVYDATLTTDQFSQLQAEGYDIVAPQASADGVDTQLVLSPAERAALTSKGVELSVHRDENGLTARQAAAEQRATGYNVWRDYDGDDGIAAYLHQFAADHKRVAKLQVVGTTLQGREIIAVRLTQEFKGKKKLKRKEISKRPATLYQGTTHAREWISTEVTLRLLEDFATNKKLLRKNQLWFVPVVNPDGYQYTFDGERLWRKNMRDNDGDGQITNLDGVDINRNYPDHWNYDDEGSSAEISSQTFRGIGPASEPETEANIKFVRRIHPQMVISYHSYGPLILYPLGWQVQTPAADDPVYVALSGTDDRPAIEGFDPDLSAELYTTNGEMTDWAAGAVGSFAWTVELEEGCDGCGFLFPDDEALVQRQFEINRAFARDLARSAADPERPKSHLGNRTEPFYLDTTGLDPTRANNPASDFTFTHSYGDPQPVEVLARRSLGKITLRYRINDGKAQKAPAKRWGGGERYGAGYDSAYRHYRGVVTATNPGDRVEVWFQAKPKKKAKKKRGKGGKPKRKLVRSDSFTYQAVSESGARTLVVAQEDYTGISPDQGGQGPNYLSFYTDALSANGIAHDVYDVDADNPYAEGEPGARVAPDHLGVLSHYDAVIWYTGDDVITREPGMVPGTASRLANDMMLEMRSFMNEGGNVLYTGKNAGVQYQNAYFYDPVENAPCDPDAEVTRCQVLSDDFLQYYLGAYLFNDGGGVSDPDTGQPFPVSGLSGPFSGLDWDLNGGDGANNQDWANSFLTTSSLLPEAQYPQFASDAPAEWDDGIAGPYEPIDGSKYMYSDRANESYKRLTRTIDLAGVTAGDAPSLRFRASYDLEPNWDYLIVEARTPGGDDWTTLPDPNHTSDDTGESCGEGWIEEVHPFLAHYQTLNPDNVSCSPTGTTGDWNAATGRSAGWEQWEIDLSAYAGQQVEISISVVSDWGTQGVGAFLDDVELTPGTVAGTTSFEDDADPLDGWAVGDAPEGSNPNPNSWKRTGSLGFEEGAIVSTADSLFFGFGFEGIADAADRNQVIGRSVEYLLNSP